jgi:hypothetical protein
MKMDIDTAKQLAGLLSHAKNIEDVRYNGGEPLPDEEADDLRKSDTKFKQKNILLFFKAKSREGRVNCFQISQWTESSPKKYYFVVRGAETNGYPEPFGYMEMCDFYPGTKELYWEINSKKQQYDKASIEKEIKEKYPSGRISKEIPNEKTVNEFIQFWLEAVDVRREIEGNAPKLQVKEYKNWLKKNNKFGAMKSYGSYLRNVSKQLKLDKDTAPKSIFLYDKVDDFKRDLPKIERMLQQTKLNAKTRKNYMSALKSYEQFLASKENGGSAQAINHAQKTPHENSSVKKGLSMNTIFYGPPGTGKTFTVQQFLEKNYEKHFTRDLLISEKIGPLKWWEACVAALYDLKKGVTVPELKDHPFIQAVFKVTSSDKNLQTRLWGTLQSHTSMECENVKFERRNEPLVFEKSANSIWSLTDNAKEQCSDIFELVDLVNAPLNEDEKNSKRWRFVTFHQSYGYEEFVEGLRPVLKEENDSGEVQYEIHEGIFKEICRIARSSPNQRFAMVIDEINRGNISKIFGELITLIESDKREGQPNEVSVILPYSHQPFSVPSNVDIIGTMNTADRSIALIDTALRRRFRFVEMVPDPKVLKGIFVEGIDIAKMLNTINKRITILLDREHTIGHSYFLPLKNDSTLARLAEIFKGEIIPLLQEYFYDDYEKVQLVLGDNQKSGDSTRFIVKKTDAAAMFGNNATIDFPDYYYEISDSKVFMMKEAYEFL